MPLIKSGTESDNLRFNSREKKKWYRCGSEFHQVNKYKFKDATCSNCLWRGHIAKACRNDARNSKPTIYYQNDSEEKGVNQAIADGGRRILISI